MSPAAAGLDEAFASAITAAIEASAPLVIDRLRPAVKAAVAEALAEAAHGAGGAAYVPLKDAALVMSAHPKTVRKLINLGKLGRFTVEGKARVKVSDIHACMERQAGPRVPLVGVALEEKLRDLKGPASRKRTDRRRLRRASRGSRR